VDSPSCPGNNTTGTTANDPAALEVKLRVPTNAKSFSFNSFFFSAEFPEFVCTTFNDFFVALVDAPVTTNPKDKNLAVYIAPDFKRYPIGVNLSYSTNLFAVCDDGPTGCSGGNPGNAKCLAGPALLTGTGFDTVTGGCGSPPNDSRLLGGGTGWLTTAGNVKPGDTMELRMAIWDTGDGIYDSLVLLDNWIWNLSPASPGTR
jgi:hypothetical protein